ncbi:MAG TPA: hypothetical protein PLP83_08125 [Candidatus Aminicenantes bacterium]|nr:hypothetical protein [Candidatus Aminicenantes bacterium]
MADLRRRTALAAAALGLAAVVPARAPAQAVAPVAPAAPLEKKLVVPAAGGWLDTGIDVGPGEELLFAASGEIVLQKGNPGAVCGPEGLDLVTVEQPVPVANLGALIGRIAQLVASRVDEGSGREVRDEIFVLFPIGAAGRAAVPFRGRLYLGVNENVLSDNGGEFEVLVVRRPL